MSTLASLVSENDLERLEGHLQSQLSGRVLDLRVLRSGAGLILRGRSHTYHAKQLAQHALMEAIDLPISANEIEVR